MLTGILLTARLGSTRLKKKHLQEVNGKPIILFLIERILDEFRAECANDQLKLVISTSTEPENKEFECLHGDNVLIYYGSPTSIPLRHLQTANNFGFSHIISIDGDDILCSVTGMRKVYQALINDAVYVKTSNLPLGMNSMGYSRDFLAASLQGHENDILETGWGRVFNKERLRDIHIPFTYTKDFLRFTLDYKEDLDFFNAVIKGLGEQIYTVSDEEIVRYVMDKELYKITEAVAKAYWINFHQKSKEEKERINKQ